MQQSLEVSYIAMQTVYSEFSDQISDPVDPWELEACAVLLQPARETDRTLGDESCTLNSSEVRPVETLQKTLKTVDTRLKLTTIRSTTFKVNCRY